MFRKKDGGISVIAKKRSEIGAFFLTTTIKLRELRVLRGKKRCLKLDQLF